MTGANEGFLKVLVWGAQSECVVEVEDSGHDMAFWTKKRQRAGLMDSDQRQGSRQERIGRKCSEGIRGRL